MNTHKPTEPDLIRALAFVALHQHQAAYEPLKEDSGYWDGYRKAVHAFELERGLSFVLNRIGASGICFVKP